MGSIPTGQPESHMLALSHDGRRGYTANVGPGTVSVLDMQARKTLKVIPISANTQRISISNDDRWVFTADQTKPRMAVIDTATNTVRSGFRWTGTGYGSAPTPDGHWLLVAMPDENKVAVVDLRTMKVARSVAVAAYPQEVLVRPDGKAAYVSCMHGNQVAEIDLGDVEGNAGDRDGGEDGRAGVGGGRRDRVLIAKTSEPAGEVRLPISRFQLSSVFLNSTMNLPESAPSMMR